MAVRWSSENVVAEHRDLQATAMALDWRGDYTLLAGRRNIALISLEKPSEIVKRVNRTQQKYDVTAAEWNPIQAQGHTFVIASGEKAEICQWTEGSLNGITTLRAHTRTITDLNWHRSDPHLLATCSIDTFVHIWDSRETRKPIASLSAIAGASQVKWNKLNQHLLASGHDCDIRVWDHRKPSRPMQYIAAHLSKIQGLDWSPNHENHLVTSSNDCTVKFFDIINPRKAENFISTLSPVWRAQYTPFGEGVVTVVVPQLRRGENSLLLWSVSDMSSPVHTFVGHSDVVLEFEWRQNLSNPGDYQLVTWARDHSLRIWKIDHQLQRLCGHDTEEEVTESTDSEYASETTPIPCPEANDLEVDGEKTDLTLTNSDSSQHRETEISVIDGCEPLKQVVTSKFNVGVVNEETPKVVTETPQEDAEEIVTTPSTGSLPSSANVTQSPSHPVKNFTSTLPAASKASTSVMGLSSTLPAGSSQSMTLQQEFSLLNTSFDNNQVNSVEVVTREVERLTESRDPKDGEDEGKVDRLEKSEDNLNVQLEEKSCRFEEDSGLEDSHTLVHTVADLVREFGENGNDEQAFSACDLNSLNTEVTSKSSDELTEMENQDGLFELRNVSVMQEAQSVSGVSEGDIKSLAVSYLLELEDTKKDLVSSSRNLHDSHIIKIKSYTDNLKVIGHVDSDKAKCSVTEESSLRISFSSESEIVSTDAVMKNNQRVTISPQDLESWLSDSSDMISLVPGVSLEEGGEATTTGKVPMKKEEAVIHIVEGVGVTEPSELLAPTAFMSGEEIATAGVSTLGETEEVVESPSMMMSLPLVTSQATISAAVMEGYILIRGSRNESLQVPAKLVYLPDSEEKNLEPAEETCAALAPQLLEGGVLVLGDNIIMMKNQLYLTHVELVAAEGDTHTQISISSPTDRMETYHDKKVNFVLITLGSDQNLVLPPSYTVQKLAGFNQVTEDRLAVRNAPHSDEPGLFQCDKCDKSYKVRSSLNSHKVTHNSEKMYKCDECDKAFHYSTPLQIHKRIHTDERPYECDRCSASFRSKANLKYHKRLHTGERPIVCRECGQCFKDYTSLKRHRLKSHDVSSLKCSECSEVCLSVEHLTAHMWQVHDLLYVEQSVNKCEKCGESFSDKRTYNNHIMAHERRDKAGHVGIRKLTDYTHQCGICNMTCQNKTQMLMHIQIHAAVKRFKCRYCSSAFMYRFLLARHVREQHPDDPEWFCQYCDEVFETCRKMTSHSCRTVRGDYSCPHCSFKTEVRHRLFRHIVKTHPEDKMPYYCEFCKNSFEDPNKLRYHQKREHPEKMLVLSLQRESAKTGTIGKDKGESPSIDMSQVEMTIEGNTLIYFIPEEMRNDDVFKEKVKFKCFYCEAKFPIKNSMTRHILREHPGEKAYKCLKCNIFLKSNVESKNHHRRYHKFSETGGRDPHRNERAMLKKAQWLQEQMNNSDSRIRNLYKFSCRFCQMVYREKRSLVAHYRKWHPDEEWDYLPDKPVRSSVQTTRKKRILIYYDCSFHDECHAVFDDLTMIREHLFNAHNVVEELSEKYVSKRLVIDHLRRGRLPKNAIDKKTKRRTGKGNAENGEDSDANVNITESDDEEVVDDPIEMDDPSDSKFGIIDSFHETLSPESSLHCNEKADMDKKRLNLHASWSQPQLHENDIGSLKDVKKMLYRCRRCNKSFPSRGMYREHVTQARQSDCHLFKHDLQIKEEPKDDDNSLGRKELSSYYKSSDGGLADGSQGMHSYKEKGRCGQKMDNINIKMEMEVCESEEESIAVTSLEERGEAFLRILTIHAPESSTGFINVKVESKENGRDTADSDLLEKVDVPATFDYSEELMDSSSSPNIGKKQQVEGEREITLPSEMSATNLRKVQRPDQVDIKPGKAQEGTLVRKRMVEEEDLEGGWKVEIGKRVSKRGKGMRESNNKKSTEIPKTEGKRDRERISQGKVCKHCHTAFKTRAELSFHVRYDH